MTFKPILLNPDAPYTLVNCANREEWLIERSKGLGGSDAATTLGENPWKTNQQLWEEKTGRFQPEDISDKPAVKYGSEAEAPLRELFALDYPEYEVRYVDNALLRNTRLPFLQVSLDGQLIDEKGRHGVLEIKTTTINHSMQRESWNEQVPQNYYCQVLHALLVTGWEFAVLKAQLKSIWPDGQRITVKHYFFERSQELVSMKTLLKAERRFWEFVQKDERPPLILPSI